MPDTGTAFFEFGTNAEQVAAQIAAAMAEIQSALGKPINSSQMAADIGGMGTALGRLRNSFNDAVFADPFAAQSKSLQGLMVKLRDGQITQKRFAEETRNLARNTIAGIPRELANSLPHTPDAVMRRMNWGGVAGQNARDYITNFNKALAELGPQIVGPSWQPFQMRHATFAKDIEAVSKRPLEMLHENQSLYNNLWNRALMESIVAQKPTLGRGVNALKHPTEKLIDQLGIRPEITALRKTVQEGGIVVREHGLTGPVTGVQRSGVVDELKALSRAREADINAARIQNREYENFAKSTAKNADAERSLTSAMNQRALSQHLLNRLDQQEAGLFEARGGRIVDMNATVPKVYKPTQEGYAVDYNPSSRRAAIRDVQEMTSAQELYNKVQEEGRRVGSSNNYLLGDQWERQAVRVTGANRALALSGLEANKVFDAQDEAIKRALVTEGNLAKQREINAIKETQRNSGFLGGFVGRFNRGEMSPVVAMGQQVASAATFTLAYGSLFALLGVLRDTEKEFMDYQDSVTDLQVATRSADMVTNQWVSDLSELSRLSGSNMGLAMDTAARGVRAFTDPLKDAPSLVREAGSATAEAATKLALIANKNMGDATGDIISIASSYGLAPDQFSQIIDAISSAKRNPGGDPAQIAQGLSLMAQSAHEAGFSLNEAADAIALVQSRTDQSGQVIATRLSRVFQIMKGSTGKDLAREMNGMMGVRVDPNATVRDQIHAYAKIYANPQTPQAVRDRITSAIGGTANLREILPLLKEGSRLAAAYQDALNSAGVGTNEFNRKTDNLVGTLQKIKGTISNIQTDVARSDIFAPFAIAVKTLDPALHALDMLIKAYDTLTGKSEAMQALLGLTLNVAVAAKVIGAVKEKQMLFHAAKSVNMSEEIVQDVMMRTGATRAEVIAIQQATTERLAAEREGSAAILAAQKTAAAERLAAEGQGTAEIAAAEAERAAAEEAGSLSGVGGMRGGLSSMWAFLKNPWTIGIGLGIGAFALAGKVIESRQAQNSIEAKNASLMRSYGRVDGTSDSFFAAGRDIRDKAGAIKQTDLGWFGDPQARDNVVKSLQARAKETDAIGRQVQKEEERAAALQKVSVFGDGAISTVDQLAQGLDAISAAGGTAITQFRLLQKALLTPPQEGRTPYMPHRLAGEVQSALFGPALKNALPKRVPFFYDTGGTPADLGASGLARDSYLPKITTGGYMYHTDQTEVKAPQYLDRQQAYNRILNANDTAQMNKILLEEEQKLGLGKKPYVTDADKAKLTAALAKRLDLQGFAGNVDKFLHDWVKGAARSLNTGKAKGMGIAPNLLNGGKLNSQQIKDLLYGSKEGNTTYPGWIAVAQGAQSAIPGSDDGTMRGNMLRSQLAFLKTMQANKVAGGHPNAQLALLIEQWQHDLADWELTRMDDLRLAEESRAKTDRELQAIRIKWAKRMMVKKDGMPTELAKDPVEVEKLFEELDQKTLKAVLNYLKVQRDIAKWALDHTRALIDNAQQELTTGPMANSVEGPVFHGQAMDGGDADKLDAAKNKADAADRNYRRAKRIADTRVTLGDKKASVKNDGSGSSSSDKLTAWQQAALRQQALIDPDQTVASARAALNVARANLDAIKPKDRNKSEYFSALQAVTQAQDSLAKAIASHASAAYSATSAQANSQLVSARMAIQTAAAQMRSAAKGTDAWYQGLAAFYQGQWQMRNAVVQYKNNLDLLHGDMTDPVEQARDAMRAAARQLASDRAGGAGKDTLAADRVQSRQSETALQKAKWDQKLADMKTAQQLGRISEAQYVSYLQHESARMHRINHKTRQQIDYMNSIDMELKGVTDSMDGMWNFGDISTRGLAYQMRRYRSEIEKDRRVQAAVTSAQRLSNVTNSVVNVNVNGADVAKVRQVLQELLGSGVRVRTTQNRRR